MKHLKNYVSMLLIFVPMLMLFAGCMLALGTDTMDLWGLGAITAGALLYKPCLWASNRLWVN